MTCRHAKTIAVDDDTFEDIMGVALLVRARRLTVCEGCLEDIRDEPNPEPVLDSEGVIAVAKKRRGGKKKGC